MKRDDNNERMESASQTAELLLAEYYRIRREYNRLNRANPEDAPRRAELKSRYYELDRRYTALVQSQEHLADFMNGGEGGSRSDVLWRAALGDEAFAEEDIPDEALWVELQTPAESTEADAVFEEALRDLDAESGDQDTPLGLTGDAGKTPVSLDSFQSILAELDSEAAGGLEEVEAFEEEPLPEVPEDAELPVPESPEKPEELSEQTESVDSTVCPSCGEPLDADTKRCVSCDAHPGDSLSEEDAIASPRVRFEPASRAVHPAIGPKLLGLFGWLNVFMGTVWLILLGTGLAGGRFHTQLAAMRMENLAESQTGLIFGLSVLLLGGALIALGLFAARFVRLVVPMHELARTGRVDIIERLILAGHDLDERDERGCTPLHYAVVAGQRETVKSLAGNGAYLNAQNDRGDTPLHMATANRDFALVEYLLSRGADASVVNESGSTLMHVAAWVGDVPLLRLYLEGGADLELRTETGFAPLHFAAQSGYVDALAFLIEEGADLDACSDVGTTPLFPAVRNGHFPAVQLLVEAGADVNVGPGPDGERLLDVALGNHRDDIAEYLRTQGTGD